LIEAIDKLHDGKIKDIVKKLKEAIHEVKDAQSKGYPEADSLALQATIAEEAREFVEGLLAIAEIDPNFDAGKFAHTTDKYNEGLALLVPPANYEEAVHKFEDATGELDDFIGVVDPCGLAEFTGAIGGTLASDLGSVYQDLVDALADPATPHCALDKLEEARKKVNEALTKTGDGIFSSDFKKYEEALHRMHEAIDKLDDLDPVGCYDTTALQIAETDAARDALLSWLDLAVEQFGELNGHVIKATSKKDEGEAKLAEGRYKDAVKKYEDAVDELEHVF
jgi:tetratricopeptide (TPR) repeat protein